MTAAGAKYFQIGFKRCGTTSLAAFFNRSGIPCAHWDRGRLGRRMQRNLAEGRPLLEGYDGRYRAFTNMEYVAGREWFEGFRHYGRLRADYPEGRFILNTRDREGWIRSMLAHGAAAGAARLEHYEWRYGTADPERVADIWRADWEEHHRAVVAELPAERLLVFDIETDPPELLCDFVGLPRSLARGYTAENPTLNSWGAALVRRAPGPVKRAVPAAVKLGLRRLLRKR